MGESSEGARGRVVVQFDHDAPTDKAEFPQISHEMRGQCPVVGSEEHGGYWVVTGRDLLGELAKRPDLPSKDHDRPTRWPPTTSTSSRTPTRSSSTASGTVTRPSVWRALLGSTLARMSFKATLTKDLE